ncbi:MAG: hypothetical protein P8Y69_02980 [Gammaproteobacteria bacterium]
MKYLTLILAGLRRRPLRTTLTVLAVAVAFLLFGVMHGLVSSFDRIGDALGETRLRVLSRANFLETLPISYMDRIAEVVLDVLPEIHVPPDQLQALLTTRTGAVAGVLLTERFGWKIGDRIPIKSLLWMNEETGQDWTFDLVAIANAGPEDERAFAQELWFHYDYLDESRTSGKGRVNQFVVGLADGADPDTVAGAIDALFVNSSDETSTLNEKQYIESNIQRIGDIESFINYILSAVLFTLLFMTATNMVQAIRERTGEIGIMRAVGFRGGSLGVLVVIESVVICVAGALLGLGIAGILFPSVFARFGLQGIGLGAGVYLQGLILAAALAVAAGAWPAWRAGTLSVVDAIAGERRR